RNSANSANMLVFNDSTMNSDGTRMLIGYVGSAEGKKGIGGIDARDSEVILGRGWTYAVKFTTTADDTKMTLSTHFYEVDA
ncbi:MAG: hypothetical protein JJE48_06675, partial [Actinobacteria bacterium]|nr:hypothetical protein [Actinomycetota bacterium]